MNSEFVENTVPRSAAETCTIEKFAINFFTSMTVIIAKLANTNEIHASTRIKSEADISANIN